MEEVPADIGSWSVMRIFQEGDRLLNKHFGVFLPAILLFIFPGSLIKVLDMQFLRGDRSDSDGESRSFLTLLFFKLVLNSPLFFYHAGVIIMFCVLTNAVYIADGNPALRRLTSRELLYGPFREMSKGKKLKACAVMVGSLMLSSSVSATGIYFTPENVAEWGLPPATIFKYTAFVTLLSTATTTYLILVNLVLSIWIRSPPSLG